MEEDIIQVYKCRLCGLEKSAKEEVRTHIDSLISKRIDFQQGEIYKDPDSFDKNNLYTIFVDDPDSNFNHAHFKTTYFGGLNIPLTKYGCPIDQGNMGQILGSFQSGKVTAEEFWEYFKKNFAELTKEEFGLVEKAVAHLSNDHHYISHKLIRGSLNKKIITL